MAARKTTTKKKSRTVTVDVTKWLAENKTAIAARTTGAAVLPPHIEAIVRQAWEDRKNGEASSANNLVRALKASFPEDLPWSVKTIREKIQELTGSNVW